MHQFEGSCKESQEECLKGIGEFHRGTSSKGLSGAYHGIWDNLILESPLGRQLLSRSPPVPLHLMYTSRVICKGRMTMEEIIFSLKHYWRFVDSEALELKALSQGVDR